MGTDPEAHEIALRTWMRNFLIDNLREDHWFDVLVRRPSDVDHATPLTSAEEDRAELFKGIIDKLTELLGSEALAATWLFHNDEFRRVVQSTPFDYLENGEFWALALLHDVLEISVARQRYGRHTSSPLDQSEGNPAAVIDRLRATPLPRVNSGGPDPSMLDFDLLSAAWGWSQPEFALALKADTDKMRNWRNHEANIPDSAIERFYLLKTVHYALWTVLPPGEYARWWRTPNAAFEGRTSLEIALEEDDGFDRVIGLCRSASL